MNINQWSALAPLLIVILLTLVLVALVVIAFILVKRRKPISLVVDTTNFENHLEHVMASTAHAAEVSAVLGLMKQLDDQPDSLALIQSYPETVRAAAWLHYINRLGSDLQYAQKQLSDAHQRKGSYSSPYADIDRLRNACQQHVDSVRAKLDRAIAASGQVGLRKV